MTSPSVVHCDRPSRASGATARGSGSPSAAMHRASCGDVQHLAEHHHAIADLVLTAYPALERDRRTGHAGRPHRHTRLAAQLSLVELAHPVREVRGRVVHRVQHRLRPDVQNELAGGTSVGQRVLRAYRGEAQRRRVDAGDCRERVRREVLRAVRRDGRHPRDRARDKRRREPRVYRPFRLVGHRHLDPVRHQRILLSAAVLPVRRWHAAGRDDARR